MIESVIVLRDRVTVIRSGEYMCAELHHGGQVFTLTQHVGPNPMDQTVKTVSGILAAQLAADVWRKLWNGEISSEPEIETVVDQFAGAGGWDVAARWLGMDPLGIENDEHACATRDAAGFRTIHADIRKVSPIPATGLISSPPCPTFSAAGRGSGRRNLDQLLELIWKLVGGGDWRALAADVIEDERTALVLEPLHWIVEMHRAATPYRWVAMEQVPPVLPVWEQYAVIMREMGYSVATGNVHAEQHGVPQTRRRAVLLASLDHEVALPAPTHSRYHPRDPSKLDGGVRRWVSMAEALGWADDRVSLRSNYGTDGDPRNRGERDIDEPAPVVTSKIDRNKWLVNNTSAKAGVREVDEPAPTMYFGDRLNKAVWTNERPSPTITTTRRSDEGGLVGKQLPDGDGRNVGGHNWPDRRPATTVNGDPRISKPGHHDENTSGSQQAGAVRVSIEEAAALQSFPDNFPWHGTKTAQFRQIGNAVPPLLAYHLLASVTGMTEISHDNHHTEDKPVAQTKWLTPKRSKEAKAHGESHGHKFGRLNVKDDAATAKCKNDGCAVTLHVTEGEHELVPDDNGVISCGEPASREVGVTEGAEMLVQASWPEVEQQVVAATADELLMGGDAPERIENPATTANDVLMGEPAQITESDGPDASSAPTPSEATPRNLFALELPPAPPVSPDDLMFANGEAWNPQRDLIDTISDAIINHPRSQQQLIGPSEIGTKCDRCLGKKLLGVPQTRDVAWLPQVGTAVHDWLDTILSECESCGWITERKVTVGIIGNRVIRGRCDAYKNGVVVDFKIVGANTLKTLQSSGPTPVYRVQDHLYGRGYELDGYEVTHVALLYLPRNSPTLADAKLHIEPYNRSIALAALDRAERIQEFVEADKANVLQLDRDPACYDCSRFAPLPGEDAPSAGPRAGNPFSGIL